MLAINSYERSILAEEEVEKSSLYNSYAQWLQQLYLGREHLLYLAIPSDDPAAATPSKGPRAGASAERARPRSMICPLLNA